MGDLLPGRGFEGHWVFGCCPASLDPHPPRPPIPSSHYPDYQFSSRNLFLQYFTLLSFFFANLSLSHPDEASLDLQALYYNVKEVGERGAEL